MNWRIYPLMILAVALADEHAFRARAFEPGPLSSVRLAGAAVAAGFVVGGVETNAPAAVRPRFPFAILNYDDSAMVDLRKRYRLDEVVSGAPNEWIAQLTLKKWVHERITNGVPRLNPKHAQDILEFAAKGEKFYCTHFAVPYVECAQALGWQARHIGVDRQHGPEGLGSTHHGVAEVWSNQFCKWVVIDPQSNLHFEKNGVPLSAWEIRAEWLKNHAVNVDHVVGVPPHSESKKPAIVWWNRKDEDETATYFWLYVTDNANPGTDDSTWKLIFPQDSANANETWYQDDMENHRGQLHVGYTRNLFLPTGRIEDAYWTVGVTAVDVKDASKGSIRLGLESYCPNQTGYEVAFDDKSPKPVKDEKSVKWNLPQGRNTLRLRTVSRADIRGPETAMVLVLE